MWTLLKGAFWFSLVLLMLPIFEPGTSTSNGPSAQEIGATVSAASQAIGYVTALCSEKPDVCVQGAKTIEALGHRAKDGARIAYSMLDSQFADDAGAEAAKTTAKVTLEGADQVVTGSLPIERIPVPVARPKS